MSKGSGNTRNNQGRSFAFKHLNKYDVEDVKMGRITLSSERVESFTARELREAKNMIEQSVAYRNVSSKKSTQYDDKDIRLVNSLAMLNKELLKRKK